MHRAGGRLGTARGATEHRVTRIRAGHLALVAVVALLWGLYGLYLAAAVLGAGLFNYVGLDFRAYWASAEIARTVGFAAVYDIGTQDEFQRRVYDLAGWQPVAYEIFPIPYLPVFVCLFMPFGLLPPVPAYWAWTAATLVVVVIYSVRIMTAASGRVGFMPVALALTALPVFAVVLAGQVDAFLLLCLGEFLLAQRSGRPGWGGVWLAGLLLKPQTLVLIGPWLLLSRQVRCLAGFALGCALVLGASVALAGIDGLLALGRLATMLTESVVTSYPESMMNWRALAINLSWILDPRVAWGVALAGLVGTLALAAQIGRRPAPAGADAYAIAVLGLYAATGAVIWHAHVYTALPLVLPLVYVHVRRAAPGWVLAGWALLPGSVFLAAAFADGSRTAHHFAGLTMLALNVALAAWAALALGQTCAADHDAALGQVRE